jgi:mycothiol S-conjugate amidase
LRGVDPLSTRSGYVHQRSVAKPAKLVGDVANIVGSGVDENKLRLMAVHAHPDDESSKGAAMMARYVAEGVQVLVVTCTGGERGDILNPAADRPENRADIGAVRRAEMAAARRILGVDHVFLGFVDSGLPPAGVALPDECFARQPLSVAAGALVAVVRSFRPHVMLTYDESGGYPHPDHVMCHRVSVAAFDWAGDPARCPRQGDPWQPSKLYYHVGSHPDRFEALHAEMGRRGMMPAHPEWHRQVAQLRAHDRWSALPITTRIVCADYFETRDRSLLAHETQVDPDSFWFAYPPGIRRAAWPTEDFYLARTLVDTEPIEDDLFAGVTVGATTSVVYR